MPKSSAMMKTTLGWFPADAVRQKIPQKTRTRMRLWHRPHRDRDESASEIVEESLRPHAASFDGFIR